MNHYYDAPPDEAFDDMKKAAQKIWGTYGEPYRSEKLERIKDVENIADNFMYLFCMFDIHNQRRIVPLLKESTIQQVRSRMEAGGNSKHLIEAILDV